VEVEWPEKPPKPEWCGGRRREVAGDGVADDAGCVDHNADGLNDLVMLDHEGYLAYFERARAGGRLTLKPRRGSPRRQGDRDKAAEPLRLNSKTAGRSGPRKLRWSIGTRTDSATCSL